MQRPFFLEYRDYRYLKATSLLVVVALVLYWITTPAGGEAYGGTWFGYVLGILSASIVLILMWYGIRKRRTPRFPERRYRTRRQLTYALPGATPGDIPDASDAGRTNRTERRAVAAEVHWRHGVSLQGWLSAHVYLGFALVILASLHSGFHFSWNLHTLTYVLMLLVVVSGLYGTFAYLHYPRLITENSPDGDLNDVLLKISELDNRAYNCTQALPAPVDELVTLARLQTRIGGTLLQQLGGRQRDCPTAAAILRLQELGKEFANGDQPRLMFDLYNVLLEKQRLLAIARREISLNARLQFWLYLHAPLAIALIATLGAHITIVLIYW